MQLFGLERRKNNIKLLIISPLEKFVESFSSIFPTTSKPSYGILDNRNLEKDAKVLIMYCLIITLLLDTETILVPSLGKGTDIMEYLRQTYHRLILDESTIATAKKISVTLNDANGQSLDHIEFQSFFGTSEMEGLKKVIDNQLNPSS